VDLSRRQTFLPTTHGGGTRGRWTEHPGGDSGAPVPTVGVPHTCPQISEEGYSQLARKAHRCHKIQVQRPSGSPHQAISTLDEGALLEILALRPTLRDVEEAALWLSGDRDIIFGAGEPLNDVVAEIVAVLSSDEDEAGPSH